MVEIKRIDPEATAKVISLIYAGLVLVVGVVYLLLVLFTFFLTLLTGGAVDNAGLLLVLLGGVGTTLFALVVFAVLGYVKGWLVAAMYNWVAHVYGGLELELKDHAKVESVPKKTKRRTRKKKTTTAKKS